MDINKIIQSKSFRNIILAVTSLVAILLILKVGIFIGYKKAGFSYRWGENYHRNFAGPKGGFFKEFEGRDFIESHGVFGEVIKIDNDSIVIKGKNDVEKLILLSVSSTIIKNSREKIELSGLKIGDLVVVIGSPNDSGAVEAKLIRLMPPVSQSRKPVSNQKR